PLPVAVRTTSTVWPAATGPVLPGPTGPPHTTLTTPLARRPLTTPSKRWPGPTGAAQVPEALPHRQATMTAVDANALRNPAGIGRYGTTAHRAGRRPGAPLPAISSSSRH